MRKELIVHRNPKSPNSEIFRTLRTNIQFMNTNKKLKTLLVTSTFPGEGKSWVTSNLAVSFAQAGKKVVLVDADMRKGRQYSIFGVSPKPGLSNFLGEAEVYDDGSCNKNIGDYIQETEVENLYVVSAGNVPPNPSELLVSAQMIKLLEDLKQLCDLVIIDGTPCELVADSIILSRIVDSSIIITAHKITKKDALERVIKNIQNVGGNLAGVVINRVPTSKGYGSKYYYYGYGVQNEKKENKKHFGFGNSLLKKTSKVKESNLEENIMKLHSEMKEIEQKSDERTEETQKMEETQKVQLEQETKQEQSSIIEDNAQNATENSSTTFLEKTKEIMNQINEYIDNEKKNLK